MAAPLTYIIVHHTGGTHSSPLADTSHHTFELINAFHKEKWQFKSTLGYYIGYHYFINKDGRMQQGKADTEHGAHTIGYNNQIGVCLAGNFDLSYPTQAQVDTLRSFLKRKTAEYSIPIEKIVPHRTFAQKTCYGQNLSDTWASTLLERAEVSTQQERADMIVYKQANNPKLYIAVGTVLLPIDTTFNAYAHDLGHATIIELTDQEFSKFHLARSLHITQRT